MTPSFLGLLTFGALGALVFFGVHLWRNARYPGPAAATWNARVFGTAQALVAVGALLDWAYGPYLLSPFGLATLGQPLLLLPSLGALLLLAWSRLFPGAYGVLFLVAGVQFFSFVPILLVLEQRLTVSFLAHGTVLTLGASAVSLFALVGNLMQDVAPPETWRGRVMLLHREGAYAALKAVAADLGLTWSPPRSILELGSVSGTVGPAAVTIDSSPRLWPPRYRVRVRVEGSGPLPATPPPAPWSLSGRPGERVAAIESPREMPFDEASLRGILAYLSETRP